MSFDFTQEESERFSLIAEEYDDFWISTSEKCIENGNFDAVRWLKEIGLPMRSNMVSFTLHYERLDILEWLIKNGCPWREEMIQWANPEIKSAIKLWSQGNGHPQPIAG